MLRGSLQEIKGMNPERSPSSEGEEKSLETPQLGRNQIWMQHIVRKKIMGQIQTQQNTFAQQSLGSDQLNIVKEQDDEYYDRFEILDVDDLESNVKSPPNKLIKFDSGNISESPDVMAVR